MSLIIVAARLAEDTPIGILGEGSGPVRVAHQDQPAAGGGQLNGTDFSTLPSDKNCGIWPEPIN